MVDSNIGAASVCDEGAETVEGDVRVEGGDIVDEGAYALVSTGAIDCPLVLTICCCGGTPRLAILRFLPLRQR